MIGVFKCLSACSLGVGTKLKIKMEKLKILITTALLLHLGLIQAQNFNYGLFAGYVCANAHVIKNNEYATKLFYPMHSFNVNGFIEYRFPGAWGIAAEPGFIRKGAVVDGDNHFLGRFDLQLNYLQLPIIANLYFTDRSYIIFGPEFAYLMSKDGNLPSLPDTYTPFEKEAYKMFTPFEDDTFEISGMIGVNYIIIRKIDIGLRYSHGLTKFSVTSWINHRYPVGQGTMGYSNVYNQYLQFIVRYKIKPD